MAVANDSTVASAAAEDTTATRSSQMPVVCVVSVTRHYTLPTRVTHSRKKRSWACCTTARARIVETTLRYVTGTSLLTARVLLLCSMSREDGYVVMLSAIAGANEALPPRLDQIATEIVMHMPLQRIVYRQDGYGLLYAAMLYWHSRQPVPRARLDGEAVHVWARARYGASWPSAVSIFSRLTIAHARKSNLSLDDLWSLDQESLHAYSIKARATVSPAAHRVPPVTPATATGTSSVPLPSLASPTLGPGSAATATVATTEDASAHKRLPYGVSFALIAATPLPPMQLPPLALPCLPGLNPGAQEQDLLPPPVPHPDVWTAPLQPVAAPPQSMMLVSATDTLVTASTARILPAAAPLPVAAAATATTTTTSPIDEEDYATLAAAKMSLAMLTNALDAEPTLRLSPVFAPSTSTSTGDGVASAPAAAAAATDTSSGVDDPDNGAAMSTTPVLAPMPVLHDHDPTVNAPAVDDSATAPLGESLNGSPASVLAESEGGDDDDTLAWGDKNGDSNSSSNERAADRELIEAPQLAEPCDGSPATAHDVLVQLCSLLGADQDPRYPAVLLLVACLCQETHTDYHDAAHLIFTRTCAANGTDVVLLSPILSSPWVVTADARKETIAECTRVLAGAGIQIPKDAREPYEKIDAVVTSFMLACWPELQEDIDAASAASAPASTESVAYTVESTPAADADADADALATTVAVAVVVAAADAIAVIDNSFDASAGTASQAVENVEQSASGDSEAVPESDINLLDWPEIPDDLPVVQVPHKKTRAYQASLVPA